MIWKTIDSAPNDGTWILVYDSTRGLGSCRATQCYSFEHYEYVHIENDLFRKVPKTIDDWSTSISGMTHWTPIDPPKPEA